MDDIYQKACNLLAKGQVIALPTETVYGLAADATNDDAVALIYSVKKRPIINPLIIHVSSFEQAEKFGVFTDEAYKLAQSFWKPGTYKHKPLTIVVNLKKDSKISKLAVAGLNTIALRVPNHEITSRLLNEYINPLAIPSANLSTEISATNAKIVIEKFRTKIPLIIDGGQCTVGVESTVLDFSKADRCVVLRSGGTTVEEIEQILGYKPFINDNYTVIKAPGMMKRHYSPSLPVFINQIQNNYGEAYLGFANYDFGFCNLSKRGDLVEAAANLFKMLYELDDKSEFSRINIAPIPNEGLGVAINDRLARAACLVG